jgi:hypothetical protein
MVDYSAGQIAILSAKEWATLQQQFQIYQIAAVMIFFVIIGIIFLFKDAIPFAISRYITHDLVVGTLEKNKRIVPRRGFELRDDTYYYKDGLFGGEPQPLPFVYHYPGTYFFCGIQFDILNIDLETIKDPKYKAVCQKLIQDGYPNMAALKKAILFSQMNGEDDPRVREIMVREGYRTYKEACLKINPKNLTVKSKGLEMFFDSISLSEIASYGDDIPPENILGEVDDIFEARKPNNIAARKLREILPICVLIVGGSAATVLIYLMFFKK